MRKVYILNGPNMNLLGLRQPEYFGHITLETIEQTCRAAAADLSFEIDFRQTNHEGVLIDWLQEADYSAAGTVLNAAGYAHTSIALLDTVLAANKPIVEVHLSNVFQRDAYRHSSYISKVADGVIVGFGENSYQLALAALSDLLGPEI
jgi:3-dehydroquinate dehydratase-2